MKAGTWGRTAISPVLIFLDLKNVNQVFPGFLCFSLVFSCFLIVFGNAVVFDM